MHLLVSSSSDIPLYRQIVRQVVEGIYGGALTPGEKLPSHRDLAEELVIAPLTVKRAYDELESAGYIATQRGRGTFVTSRPPGRDARTVRGELKQLARDLLTRAYSVDLDVGDVTRVIEEAAEDMAVGLKNTRVRREK